MARSIYERIRAAQAKADRARAPDPHSSWPTEAQIQREALRDAAIERLLDEDPLSDDPELFPFGRQFSAQEIRRAEREICTERQTGSAA